MQGHEAANSGEEHSARPESGRATFFEGRAAKGDRQTWREPSVDVFILLHRPVGAWPSSCKVCHKKTRTLSLLPRDAHNLTRLSHP